METDTGSTFQVVDSSILMAMNMCKSVEHNFFGRVIALTQRAKTHKSRSSFLYPTIKNLIEHAYVYRDR